MIPSRRAALLGAREARVFFALTVVTGIIAGLIAVLFALAIDLMQAWSFGLEPGAVRLVLVPTLASLVAGVLLSYVFPDSRGSGIPQTEAAYHLHGGRIPARVPIGKFITGVLCVGSGHSLGREGPSVQLGAGVASVIARWTRLSPERARDLLPVGAAGALSAAFNTPVAAVLFTLEELIGDMNAGLIGSAVVASVASVIVQRALVGNEPLLHVPGYELVHPGELLAYAALGVIGGILSVGFCRLLLASRAAMLALSERSRVLQPAMGGLLVGLLLIWVPEVMGVGYEYVDQALNGGLVLPTLLLLGAAKFVATIVSYSSGNAGGIFAPTLYLGAMAGGAVGLLWQMITPFPAAGPGAYALVGMGTLFAGIIRAPMTSVFMIFELTQDYQIIVPLMVANLLSFLISRRYQPVPIYHAFLEQDGVHLPTMHRGLDAQVRAADLMAETFVLVAPDTPVARAAELVQGNAAALVGSDGRLDGVVTAEELGSAQGRGEEPVRVLAQPATTHVHPDHPLDEVVERLATTTVLPVVSRSDVTRLEGVITPSSLSAGLLRAGRRQRERAGGAQR